MRAEWTVKRPDLVPEPFRTARTGRIRGVVAQVSLAWHSCPPPTPLAGSKSADSTFILSLADAILKRCISRIPNRESYNICYNNVRIGLLMYLYSFQCVTREYALVFPIGKKAQ
jgi:hypothetical protein